MTGLPAVQDGDGRQARDVMAFGQEVGRVLSDGRVVGRAEPFAKVFPSSRAVKRAVGLLAWGVLEDIALDARLDERGRLVSETNVRRIAANLGLSKTTVHKHLAALREYGFVFGEEIRAAETGRYEQTRYVIDPSACIERFTIAPSGNGRPAGDGGRRGSGARDGADHRVPVSGTRTVYQSTGHGDLGRDLEEAAVQQQTQQTAPATAPARDDGLVAALSAAGVAASIAAQLVDERPADRIRDALEAADGKQLHNRAGWLVRAIAGDWDLGPDLAETRRAAARARQVERGGVAAARRHAESTRQRRHEAAWNDAISAALGAAQLAEAIDRLTVAVAGVERKSVPLCCSALRRWAQSVAAAHPGAPLAEVLVAALRAHPTPADVPDSPPEVSAPPTPRPRPPALSDRVSAYLADGRERRTEPAAELSR